MYPRLAVLALWFQNAIPSRFPVVAFAVEDLDQSVSRLLDNHRSAFITTTIRSTIAAILAVTILTACNGTATNTPSPAPQENTPTSTATQVPSTPSPTASETPIQPTQTENSPTPSLTPNSSPTPENRVIGPDNAAQLQQVDQASQSGAQLFTWLPGETALALATGTEIHLYSLDPLAETSAIEVTATTRLAASPGGGQLAAARQDYSILLWDVAGQSEVATLKGHTQEVTGIDYAPDGQLLASSSADNTLKLWDSSDGSLIQTWDLPFWPSSVEFSPDGSQLALIDPQEFSAHIFDVPEGEEQRTLAWTEHASPVLYSASFSPDWTALAWVARGTIQLMDAETGELGHTLSHEEFISDMAWSPDGSLVAAAAAATVEGEFHPAVVLWDVQAGQQVNVLVQSQVAFDVSFSPDGTHLAILSSDGVLSLWAVAD